MKKYFKTIALGYISLAFIVSCSNSAAEADQKATVSENANTLLAENKASVEMKVEGMVCAMGCAKYIQDEVAKLDGVVLSQVNFEEASAHFEFDKNQLTPEEIEKFINEIHDGQYKAIISGNQSPAEAAKDKESKEEKKTIGSVSERLNFSFPELFTYFLKRI